MLLRVIEKQVFSTFLGYWSKVMNGKFLGDSIFNDFEQLEHVIDVNGQTSINNDRSEPAISISDYYTA